MMRFSRFQARSFQCCNTLAMQQINTVSKQYVFKTLKTVHQGIMLTYESLNHKRL